MMLHVGEHDRVMTGSQTIGDVVSTVYLCTRCQSYGHGIDAFSALDAEVRAIGFLSQQPCVAPFEESKQHKQTTSA